MRWIVILCVIAIGYTLTLSAPANSKGPDLMDKKPANYPVAILAGGCFWCVESELRAMNGILFTRSGYIGGHLDNPKYEDTHDSKSGHAEAVEVTYDPKKITYEKILDAFMRKFHDPTELNRQGPNVGTQYRSAIFYGNEAEKKTAQGIIDKLTAEKVYSKPIVTTLEAATKFWEAEAYHQQYYEKYEQKHGQPHINDWLKRQRRAVSGE